MLNINSHDKILIVAPHADDETIGCGGLLSLYGSQCDILLITDGRLGQSDPKKTPIDELISIRKHEIETVSSITSVNNLTCLSIPDQETNKNIQIIMKQDIRKYSYVFVPYHLDNHIDHNILMKLFYKMIIRQHSNAKLFEYEVWSPLKYPSDIIDISTVIENKIQLINIYKSQNKYYDYTNMTIGLSKYRGAFIGCQYGEAYNNVPILTKLQKLYSKIPLSIRQKIYSIKN